MTQFLTLLNLVLQFSGLRLHELLISAKFGGKRPFRKRAWLQPYPQILFTATGSISRHYRTHCSSICPASILPLLSHNYLSPPAATNVDRPARQIRLPWQKGESIPPNESETFATRRVPMLSFLPLKVKNHFVAMMGEFAGTFLFLLCALGGTNVVNAAPEQGQSIDLAANPAKLLFIALRSASL